MAREKCGLLAGPSLYVSADKSYRCLSLSVVSDYERQLTLAYSRLIPECAVSHVTSVLAFMCYV